MTKLYIALALAFPSIPIPSRAPDFMWRDLKKLADVLELAGPVCVWTDNYRAEVGWVRNRWLMTRDCPGLSECGNLPPYPVCRIELIATNRTLMWMEAAAQERLHWEWLHDALPHARRVQRFWTSAMRAQSEHEPWWARREALREIQTLIQEINQ